MQAITTRRMVRSDECEEWRESGTSMRERERDGEGEGGEEGEEESGRKELKQVFVSVHSTSLPPQRTPRTHIPFDSKPSRDHKMSTDN